MRRHYFRLIARSVDTLASLLRPGRQSCLVLYACVIRDRVQALHGHDVSRLLGCTALGSLNEDAIVMSCLLIDCHISIIEYTALQLTSGDPILRKA